MCVKSAFFVVVSLCKIVVSESNVIYKCTEHAHIRANCAAVQENCWHFNHIPLDVVHTCIYLHAILPDCYCFLYLFFSPATKTESRSFTLLFQTMFVVCVLRIQWLKCISSCIVLYLYIFTRFKFAIWHIKNLHRFSIHLFTILLFFSFELPAIVILR